MPASFEHSKRWLCGGALSLLFFACHTTISTPDLRSAMQTYDRLIQKTDADSIAQLYTIDGELGAAARGRDSIRKFLLRFKDFKVLEQLSTIDSIHTNHDTGYVSGTFHQRTIMPVHDSTNAKHEHDTVTIHGNFRSVWISVPEYGWQIRRMETDR